MKDGLYHIDVYFPREVMLSIEKFLSKKVRVLPTNHYYEKAKMCNLGPNSFLSALYGSVVEAEVSDGVVVKIVTRLRHRYDNTKDICFAVQLHGSYKAEEGCVAVKTVWVNGVFDNHDTLNKGAYVKK